MYEKRLRAGTVHPRKQKTQEDLNCVQIPEGYIKMKVVPSDRTKDNGHKLKHRTFPLSIGKHL